MGAYGSAQSRVSGCALRHSFVSLARCHETATDGGFVDRILGSRLPYVCRVRLLIWHRTLWRALASTYANGWLAGERLQPSGRCIHVHVATYGPCMAAVSGFGIRLCRMIPPHSFWWHPSVLRAQCH